MIWQGNRCLYDNQPRALYLLNLAIKYLCTIPLAIIFFDDNPSSQFASSLNQIGCALQDCLFSQPDLALYSRFAGRILYHQDVAEARGMEVSKKASLMQRIKGNLRITLRP